MPPYAYTYAWDRRLLPTSVVAGPRSGSSLPWRPLVPGSSRVQIRNRQRYAVGISTCYSSSSPASSGLLFLSRMAANAPITLNIQQGLAQRSSSSSADSRQARLSVRAAAAAAAAACPFPDQPTPQHSRTNANHHGQAIDMLINLKRSSSTQDPQHPLNPAAGQHQPQKQGHGGAEAFLCPDDSSAAGAAAPGSWQIHTQLRHSVEEAFKAIVHMPGSSSSRPQWQGLYQIEWEEQQQQLQHWQQHQQQLLLEAPERQQQHQGVEAAAPDQQQLGSHMVARSSSRGHQQQQHSAAAVQPQPHGRSYASSSSSGMTTAEVLSPHALTKQIQSCKSGAALELLLQQHWPRLDHIHTAAAFVQLARMQRSSSGAAGSSAMSAGMLQQLQQLAASQLPFMQSRHVSNVLWAAANLNLKPHTLWVQGFMDRAYDLFSRGTAPQGFANILWALANLKVQPSRTWMDAFFAASQPHLHNFQAQELSSTMWALGSLAVQPPPVWQCSYFTASTAKMGTCNAQALSNQLWAVAKLGLATPESWTAAVTYAAQMRAKEFTPLGLSNLLWAAAKLHGKLQQQHHQQGSHLACSAAAAGAASAGWGREMAASSGSMGRVILSSISNSSGATSWLQPLLTAAMPHVQHFNAHCLSNVIWSLSVLEHSGNPEFVQACADQLMIKCGKLSAAGTASAVWGLARLGFLPHPEQQVAPLLRHLQTVLPHSNAQQLVYVAAALACFRQQQRQAQQQLQGQQEQHQNNDAVEVPQQLLQQYLVACKSSLSQFAPGQLCELGRWLAAAVVTPEPAWTNAYLSCIAQQLGMLKPQHHIAVLSTLGAWRVTPHAGWSAMFLAAIAAEHVVGSYSAVHVGALLQCFAAANVQPQQHQLDLLLQQVLLSLANGSSSGARPPSAPATAAASVLQGLCVLGFRPSEAWLQRFWDLGANGGLAGANAASLTALAVSLQLPELTRLRIRPSKAWGAAYHAAVAAVLSNAKTCAAAAAVADVSAEPGDGFKPQQAAAVLAALAAVKRQPQHQEHPHLLVNLMAAAGSGLQDMQYAEAVAAWWALTEFGVLSEAVPLAMLQQEQAEPAAEQQQEQEQWSLQQWQCHWLQRIVLSPEVEVQVAAADLRTLLQLGGCLSRLQQPTPSSWADAYATAVAAHIPQLQSHQLATLLCAVPTLASSAHHAALTSQLLAAIQPQLAELSPKQFSDVLVAVQQNPDQLPSERWLAEYVTAASVHMPNFLGRQLIRVLTSLARLRFCPEAEFLSAASNAAVDRLGSGVPAHMLVDLLWALTALHVKPNAAWFARFEARMLEKGPERLDGGQLSRLGWCLAALQVKPGQLLMARYLVAAGEQLANMDARSLADTLWACAMLDEKPGKHWLDCFLAESRKLLPIFPSGGLVTVMWALAMMQHRPPSDWMARCLTALGSCLEAGNSIVTNGVGNPSSGRLQLQRPQLPGTAAAAGFNSNVHMHHPAGGGSTPHLTPLSPQQVTRVAWALAALDCQLPAQLMQLLMQRAEAHIRVLDSDSLAQLVWALDRLDDTPEKLWVRRFAATARAHLLSRPPTGHNGGSGGLAPSSSVLAIAGFRPLGDGALRFGVQQQGFSKGPAVLVKPVRPSTVAVGHQQPAVVSVPLVTHAAAAAAAAGIVVQQDIADELDNSLVTATSKQELLAKLRQMKQQSA